MSTLFQFSYGFEKNGSWDLCLDDAWSDIFRQIQMQYPSASFSHESSLYLHGMSEREPDPIGYPVRCYNIERTLCEK